MSENDGSNPKRELEGDVRPAAPLGPLAPRRSGAFTKIEMGGGRSAQGSAAAGALHDLRNLLSVISTCSETAIEDVEAGSELFETLIDIRTAATRASVLVETMATGARTGRSAEATDVGEVITEFLSVLRRQGGSRVVLAFEPADGGLRAHVDRHALEHALLNLVANAVDAMPVPGTVTIRTAAVEGVIRISVSDTGSGMDAATLARAFEPRFTTKGALRRSGLGLGIVRSFIEEAGGRVTATSQLRAGTEVLIELPAALS